MLGSATTLALLTTSGFIVIYLKLPKRLKDLIKKYNLLTDAASLLAIYLLLGGTLTALTAASISGLIISILLYISKKEKTILDILSTYKF